MKNYRAISLLICALLLLTASCGTESQIVQTDETTIVDSTENQTETGRTEIKDSLPKKDYGGADFNILCRTEWNYEFDVAEQTGDLVSDAVYDRNRAIEERFNVNFEFTSTNGSWDERNTFLDTLNGSILAGDGEFDMVAGYQAYMIIPAMEGYFLNILDMNHIDLDAPWWYKKCNDSTTVNNKLYMTTGDIAISFWENIYVMLFNKKLAGEYNIPDMYQLVNDGDWTIDKLSELSILVGSDLDGDSIYSQNDLYGFASGYQSNHIRMWQVACNLPITTPDKSGFMQLSFNTERTQNVLDKMVTLYSAQSSYTIFDTLKEPRDLKEPTMFIEDRVLFTTAYMGSASLLRDMNTDFGIIPYPKYDNNQSEYRTTTHNSVSMICFPKTVKDQEMSTIITEALCAESNRNIIPKYYEILLKTKIARDSESEAMIDLIRDSIVFDFGWVHSLSMDSIGVLLADLIGNKSTDFASEYAKKEPVYIDGLNKINKAYGKE